MPVILDTEEINQLLTSVEEAARSTEEAVKHFVEPARGTLRRATSKRHHIVFGRRGSGKTSLLRKAAASLQENGRPIAYVNLEAFKDHSYPDVLLSVLIAAFGEFKKWLDSTEIQLATPASLWERVLGTLLRRGSDERKKAIELFGSLSTQIDWLMDELNLTDEAELTVSSSSDASERDSAGVRAAAGIPPASVEGEARGEVIQRRTEELEERYRRSKTDFLNRHIIAYQDLFRCLGQFSRGDAYLFMDDLYHIRRGDQPKVMDYFHRVAKEHHLWLKIGTIRHRTRWYLHGDPPTGLKLGDDADLIDLDLTLDKYSLAKTFLAKILATFASAAGLKSLADFLTNGALDRLVLASGGVARDFLSIFRRSVDVAGERGGGHRGDKVGAEDVNAAAGEYDSSKREEFEQDTLDDNVTLDREFQKVREFCLERNNTNCFLLDKEERGPEVDLIHELVDLKLIHLVRSRVTVSGRRGKIYEAYMLDLSQYAGARKKRGLEIVEFWKSGSDEVLRKASLIYSPNGETNR